MRFRKRPVIIEAVQYTGRNGYWLRGWSEGKVVESPVLEPSTDNPTGSYVQIRTLEGTMVGVVGDWIIRGVKGEFYPCKPDVFVASYEPAEQQATAPPTCPGCGGTECGPDGCKHGPVNGGV